jgi:hypothetical protein
LGLKFQERSQVGVKSAGIASEFREKVAVTDDSHNGAAGIRNPVTCFRI